MSIVKDYLIPVSGLRFTDHVAAGWSPQHGVVLDPAVQFGEPCIHHTRIPTSAAWVHADDEAKRRRPKLLVAHQLPRRQWRRPGELRQLLTPGSSP